MTDPLGNNTAYTYDSSDNRTSTTDGNGHLTSFTYDLAHRLTRQTNALGGQTSYTYDAAGNILTITDAAGNTTSFAYDAGNRKESETNAAGETTSYTYDVVGNLLTTARPNGNTLTRTYDRLGRLTALSDSVALVGAYTYDLSDRQLTTANALGNTTAYTYDAIGSVVRTTDPMGSSTTYVYDAVARPLTITDREGNATNYAYDAWGSRISETDPLGATTTYAYDTVGNLIEITDARGNTTRETYDADNRLVTETYTDGTTRNFAYDSVGNVISRTDHKGQVTAYVYDAINRRTQVDYPGTNDNIYTYDPVGNILTANNSNATISFAYDRAYRRTQSVQNGRNVAYSYDTAAGTKTITYPGGKVVREIRNVRGLLRRVEDASAQPIVQYVYDAADGIQTKTFLNGVVGSFTRNPNGWVTQLTYDRSGSQILGFQYTFDREGNRLYARHLHDTGKSEQYLYDAKYRLTQFKRGILDAGGSVAVPATQTAYNLDALGNWTSKITDGVTQNRTHNNTNEVVAVDGSALTYDDNGNLVDDGTNTYEYDYENHLVQVARKSDSAVLGEYKYDALGRRVEKQASGTTTTYCYEENREIEERVAGSTRTAYTYGNDIDEVLAMEQESSGRTYYYLLTAIGTVASLCDDSGSIVEQYDYDAYGTSSVASLAHGNHHMFTGRLFDEEVNSYYYRARHYNSRIGRFLQRDPLGHKGGPNFYEYVGSNPINRIDPFGLDFVVVGSRPVTGWVGAFGSHMSLEYFNKDCPTVTEGTSFDSGTVPTGAHRTSSSVELLVDSNTFGYWWTSGSGLSSYWVSVQISVINYGTMHCQVLLRHLL